LIAVAIDTADSINYATRAAYAPQGGLSALTLGSAGSFAGINLSGSYNTRLQPNELKASSTAGTAMDLTYSFADANRAGGQPFHTPEVNACLLRVPAGGQPFHATEVKAYLLRVPHSLAGGRP
jgi:hypothetical protein